MPSLTFNIKYGKNDGLLMSPSELLRFYFHGISTIDSDCRDIPESTLKQKLEWAQDEVEKYFSIKVTRKVVEEQRDFIRSDYNAWGYLRMTYPVREPIELNGFISTTKQVEFPFTWLSNHLTSEEYLWMRNISIVPAGDTSPQTNSVIFVGITPNIGFLGLSNIPNYWNMKYCTGFSKVPPGLLDVIGKYAAMQVFAILGDIVLGAGIAAQSLSVDGLSQSIETTQSAENSAYSARVRQYQQELKQTIPVLKDRYKGITFSVLG